MGKYIREADNFMKNNKFAKGYALFQKLHGGLTAEKVVDDISAISPELSHYTMEWIFADLYSNETIDIPNDFEPDSDNNPSLEFNLDIKNSKICFPSDFQAVENIITLKSDVSINVKKPRIKGVKEKLTDFYEELMMEQEKAKEEKIEKEKEKGLNIEKKQSINEKKEVEKKEEVLRDSIISKLKSTIFSLTVKITESFLMTCDLQSIRDLVFTTDNRKMIVNSKSEITYKTVLQIEKQKVYLQTTEIMTEVDKSTLLLTYKDLILFVKAFYYNLESINYNSKENLNNTIRYTIKNLGNIIDRISVIDPDRLVEKFNKLDKSDKNKLLSESVNPFNLRSEEDKDNTLNETPEDYEPYEEEKDTDEIVNNGYKLLNMNFREFNIVSLLIYLTNINIIIKLILNVLTYYYIYS